MDTINYRPQKQGFPYKLLKYLYDNGQTSGTVLQKEIGLNAHFDAKGSIYFFRASQTFDQTAKNLQNRGLLEMLPNDFYKLTKSGKTFIENYNVR